MYYAMQVQGCKSIYRQSRYVGMQAKIHADTIGWKKWFYAAMVGTFTLAFSTGLIVHRIHVVTVKKN